MAILKPRKTKKKTKAKMPKDVLTKQPKRFKPKRKGKARIKK